MSNPRYKTAFGTEGLLTSDCDAPPSSTRAERRTFPRLCSNRSLLSKSLAMPLWSMPKAVAPLSVRVAGQWATAQTRRHGGDDPPQSADTTTASRMYLPWHRPEHAVCLTCPRHPPMQSQPAPHVSASPNARFATSSAKRQPATPPAAHAW